MQGLGALNKHLSDKSYIDGFSPSTADITVLQAVGAPPDCGPWLPTTGRQPPPASQCQASWARSHSGAQAEAGGV